MSTVSPLSSRPRAVQTLDARLCRRIIRVVVSLALASTTLLDGGWTETRRPSAGAEQLLLADALSAVAQALGAQATVPSVVFDEHSRIGQLSDRLGFFDRKLNRVTILKRAIDEYPWGQLSKSDAILFVILHELGHAIQADRAKNWFGKCPLRLRHTLSEGFAQYFASEMAGRLNKRVEFERWCDAICGVGGESRLLSTVTPVRLASAEAFDYRVGLQVFEIMRERNVFGMREGSLNNLLAHADESCDAMTRIIESLIPEPMDVIGSDGVAKIAGMASDVKVTPLEVEHVIAALGAHRRADVLDLARGIGRTWQLDGGVSGCQRVAMVGSADPSVLLNILNVIAIGLCEQSDATGDKIVAISERTKNGSMKTTFIRCSPSVPGLFHARVVLLRQHCWVVADYECGGGQTSIDFRRNDVGVIDDRLFGVGDGPISVDRPLVVEGCDHIVGSRVVLERHGQIWNLYNTGLMDNLSRIALPGSDGQLYVWVQDEHDPRSYYAGHQGAVGASQPVICSRAETVTMGDQVEFMTCTIVPGSCSGFPWRELRQLFSRRLVGPQITLPMISGTAYFEDADGTLIATIDIPSTDDAAWSWTHSAIEKLIRIVDANDQPIDGCKVWISRIDDGGHPIAESRPRKAGVYAFRWTAASATMLNVDPPQEFAPLTRSGSVGAGEVIRLTKSRSVHGLVLGLGAEVSSTFIEARWSNGAQFEVVLGDGSFALGRVGAEDLEIRVVVNSDGAEDRLGPWTRVDAADSYVRLRMP